MLGCLFPSPWVGKTPTQLGLLVVLFTATEQPPTWVREPRVDGAGPGSLILKAHHIRAVLAYPGSTAKGNITLLSTEVTREETGLCHSCRGKNPAGSCQSKS